MPATSPPEKGAALAPALGVALLALAVRAVYLAEIRHSDVFDLVLGDGKYFLAWSRHIRAGAWVGTETYMAPLYAYTLAAIQALAGPGLLAVKIVQVGIGALGCGLLAYGAARLGGVRVGWIAGVLLALYPPAIFSDALIQKSVLDVFLVAALVIAISAVHHGPRRRNVVFLGLVLGALALVRENTMVWVPTLCLWFFLALPRPAAVKCAALLSVTFLAVLAPWTLRNFVVTGEVYATTHNFGVNLYMGNRLGAAGVYEPLLPGRGNADDEWGDAVRLAEAAEGRSLRPSEVSRYWATRAARDVVADPAAWLGLVGRKALLYASAVERMDTEAQYAFTDESLLLRALDRLYGFGWLAPLACFGAVLTWRRRPEQRVLWALVGVYSAVAIVFVVSGRYRLPAAVLLTYPAALGLDALPGLVRMRAWLRLSLASAVAAVVALVSFRALADHPLLDRNIMRASTALNVGIAKGRMGDPRASERALRLALALHPDFPLAHQTLAQLLVFEGRLPEAEASYRRAIASSPGYERAHAGLGAVLLRQGRRAEAISQLERSIALDPSAVDSMTRLREARRTGSAPAGASPPPGIGGIPPALPPGRDP